MSRKTTVSITKCDIGSLAGRYSVPKPLSTSPKKLKKAKEEGLINSTCHKMEYTTLQQALDKLRDRFISA